MTSTEKAPWQIGVWRADNWQHQAMPEKMEKVKWTGETWIDGQSHE